MRSSRFYQNAVQTIGSVGEVVLFLCGFFLGKGMFYTALIFLIIRIIHKLVISELMYRRMQCVVNEESRGGDLND